MRLAMVRLLMVVSSLVVGVELDANYRARRDVSMVSAVMY